MTPVEVSHNKLFKFFSARLGNVWHLKYIFVVNLILLCTIMLLYFSRAPFMLVHCLIDDICLLDFANIYILIILLLCLLIYVFIFLNLLILLFGGPHWKYVYYCVL